ncbi:MAG: polysaccharide deacetylase family protein [Xanthomonadaceae bacterium]|nr:polysaccharide deacetylase family protein [Xanthomonadaceae bacterium]
MNQSAPVRRQFLIPQIVSRNARDDGRRNGVAAQCAKPRFLNESHVSRFNRCFAGLSRILLIVVAGLVSAVQVMADSDHAVVLLYHHVSDRTPSSTSVSPQQFQRHLEFLHQHEFEVWPLDQIIKRLFDQSLGVPDNVVAITFDDAYESIHDQAWPMLEKYGWTATVFVNTDAVDQGHKPYMNWDQLRELTGAGFALGNHSASHAHLLAHESGETADEWRRRVTEDIRRAERRIFDETGLDTRLLAYPFGEDSIELAGLIDSLGYRGLTQRSGAIGAHTDDRAIPRFPMAQGFDSIERLELAVRARPLPVTRVRYQPPREQGVVENPTALHFKIRPGGWRPSQLAC